MKLMKLMRNKKLNNYKITTNFQKIFNNNTIIKLFLQIFLLIKTLPKLILKSIRKKWDNNKNSNCNCI